MTMTLYYHPLSSYCWKALIGLYELEIPFEKHLVDLSNEGSREAFRAIWPIAKFPVLRDDPRGRTLPESSILLEYADTVSPARKRLIPDDSERAVECRLRDRIFDLYVHAPLQKIVDDRLRPEGVRDPHGVSRAREQLDTSYALVDRLVAEGPWAMGNDFSLADCAAFPALFYADKVAPFARFTRLAAYFERLKARPSIARVLDEAKPYLHMFPG